MNHTAVARMPSVDFLWNDVAFVANYQLGPPVVLNSLNQIHRTIQTKTIYTIEVNSNTYNNGFTLFPKSQVTVMEIKVKAEQSLRGEVSEMEFVWVWQPDMDHLSVKLTCHLSLQKDIFLCKDKVNPCFVLFCF